MFDWLQREFQRIRTEDFHLMKIGETVLYEDQKELLPLSYNTFLEQFGGVKLFKRRGYYLISVFATPQHVLMFGEEFLYIGFSSRDGHAYFRLEDIYDNSPAIVYEVDNDIDRGEEYKLENTRKTFDQWLKSRYRIQKRNYYTAEKWKSIVSGLSFTEADLKKE
jgi:hypothetical protein